MATRLGPTAELNQSLGVGPRHQFISIAPR